MLGSLQLNLRECDVPMGECSSVLHGHGHCIHDHEQPAVFDIGRSDSMALLSEPVPHILIEIHADPNCPTDSTLLMDLARPLREQSADAPFSLPRSETASVSQRGTGICIRSVDIRKAAIFDQPKMAG